MLFVSRGGMLNSSYKSGVCMCLMMFVIFFFQAEDGIRDLVRSRGLGDVYKRQLRAVVVGVGQGLLEEFVVLAGFVQLQVDDLAELLSLIHI